MSRQERILRRPANERGAREQNLNDVGLSVGYDDNLSLTEDNEVSDTIVTPMLLFTAEQDGPRVQVQARGDFRYPMYLDNTFDDRFRGKFAGNVNWTMLPERLDWVFQDYMSPQQIGEAMGLSYAAVRTLLCRARGEMRRALAAEGFAR